MLCFMHKIAKFFRKREKFRKIHKMAKFLENPRKAGSFCERCTFFKGAKCCKITSNIIMLCVTLRQYSKFSFNQLLFCGKRNFLFLFIISVLDNDELPNNFIFCVCRTVAYFCTASHEQPGHDYCIARKLRRRSWRRVRIHYIGQMS